MNDFQKSNQMSGSDIRDILQLGSPTEPLQKRSKPAQEKRPGTERKEIKGIMDKKDSLRIT